MFNENDVRPKTVYESVTIYHRICGKVPHIPNQVISLGKGDIPYKANYDRLAKIVRELGVVCILFIMAKS